jgi:HSP20 family protein
MQPLRNTIRTIPRQFHRITKPNPTTRHLTSIPSVATMSVFPHFTQELAPLLRLMNDYETRAFRDVNQQLREVRSFTPKFDVKELADAYELYGEFPGIEQKDISIEWTDANTLTVKGRHEKVREEGERPDTKRIEEGKHSPSKSPTVEDETPEPNSSTQVTQKGGQEVAKRTEGHQPRYWVSERSVGEFHRSFSFPTRVDQDAVKASLKNGILSVVVPKGKAPQPRKVNIE